ncbi:MAG TPA: TolC family protein [Planctomycetaceae bacterium]|nr:TolC family protein [Planctomycetaceae bacterium]HQZ65294.1 TolC family protein [Planctomycetaceae bacterium]
MKSIASRDIAIWLRQRIIVSVRAMRRLPRLGQRLRTLCPSTATELGIRLPRLAMVAALSSSLMLSGCSMSRKKSPCDLHYADGDKPITSYRDYGTAIEYPAIDNVTARAVQLSGEPRNLQRNVDDEVREVTLHELMLTALSHNEIIESTALGGVGSKVVLTNPAGVMSVYDSAIQESGILFGRRGMDAALSDFDARLASSLTYSGADTRTNVTGLPYTTNDGGAFNTTLSKALATGANVSVSSNWSNNWSNSTANYYPSAYQGAVGAQIVQPLLAGSGVEFTRVAGTTNPSFGAITGVSQGVAISRINQDISLADFEIAVRNGLRDIENSYWDLYLAYRQYDSNVAAHESAFQTWREAQTKLEVGTLDATDELQARDRLYETKAALELALNQLYQSEGELRRLVGLPMNDGFALRPAEEPILAELCPDWQASLVDGLTNRVELRRQKWQIKSLQLQLDAANSLVRPTLNAVAGYNVLGFGNNLISQRVNDPLTGTPTNSAVGSMSRDDLNSWTAGMTFSMPVGLRQARSQARNYELQLAKANALLAAQERSIAHDIASAIQDVTANYTAAQSNRNRMLAADQRVPLLMAQLEVGTTTLDLVLRAQASAAAAEISYYQQVVAYNKAITNLNLATGRLLEFNNIYLQEGKWCPEAYDDALLRAQERTHACDNPHLDTQPAEFVSGRPVGGVELQTPIFETSPAPEIPASEIPPGDADTLPIDAEAKSEQP